MKTNRKKMMTKLILAGLALIGTFFWSVLSAEATATGNKTIYAGRVTAASGIKGSATNPYTSLEDAIAAAKDGDTIRLLSGGIIVNDTSKKDYPLEINKAVTIEGNSIDINDMLVLSSGGIILSKDVTFRNICIKFTNTNHVGIFANGHKLTLENVVYSDNISATYTPQIYAGGLTTSLSNVYTTHGTAGTHGQIVVKGSSTQIYDIYAGGEKQDFQGRVTITIEGRLDRIGSIYVYGADGSAVNGKVTVNLNDSDVAQVMGSNMVETNVNYSSQYLRETALYNIAGLTVKSGKLSPKVLGGNVAITIEEEGLLDLSKVMESSNTFKVRSIQGNGGTLILGSDDTLTVSESLSGTTNLKIGSMMSSVQATQGHDYVIMGAGATVEGEIVFDVMDSAQESVKLVLVDGKWVAEKRNRVSINDSTITVTLNSDVYDGQEKKVILTKDGVRLKEGTDYVISKMTTNLVDAGSNILTITGIGDYTDSMDRTVKIDQAELPQIEEQIVTHRISETGPRTAYFVPVLPTDMGTTYFFSDDKYTDSQKILSAEPDVDFKTGAVTYTLVGKEAYNSSQEAVVPIRISPTNYKAKTVNLVIRLVEESTTVPLSITSADTVVYGKTLSLSTEGGLGSGQVSYQISSGTGEATIKDNVLTPVKAGTVTVTAHKAADAENAQSSSTPMEITIQKAIPQVIPAYQMAERENQILEDASLSCKSDVPGRICWVDAQGVELDENTVIQVRESYRWKFTPDDDNYEICEGRVTLLAYSDEERNQPATIYIQEGNTQGDGSQDAPYGDFETALEMSKSGDTLVIMNGGVSAEDAYNTGEPLIIDKAITIQGEGGDTANYEVTLGYAGIVLDADVIFKNLTIKFTVADYSAIYANGYKLTVENVSLNSGTYGGSLYAGSLSIDGTTYGREGDHGEIVIGGSATRVDNIYTSGKDCGYYYPAAVTLEGELAAVGKVYGFAAAYVDTTINLNNSNVKEVYGSAENWTEVVFTSQDAQEVKLENVASIVVKEGELKPDSLADDVEITLKAAGTLNLRPLADSNGNKAEIYALNSQGGTLRLGDADTLTISDTLTGNTKLEIVNENDEQMAVKGEHTYIDASAASGSGTFTLKAYSGQTEVTLENKNGLWTTPEIIIPSIQLEQENVTVSIGTGAGTTAVYTGREQSIAVSVVAEQNTLRETKDYKVSYQRKGQETRDLTDAGDITVIITGCGAYYGTVTKTVRIEKADFEEEQSENKQSYAYAKTGEYSVRPECNLPLDAGNISYQLANTYSDTQSILANTPTVDAGTGEITYSLKGQAGYFAQQRVDIPLQITMDNYNDVIVNYTIELVDKENQAELKVTVPGTITYGKTITLSVAGGSGDGRISYDVQPAKANSGQAELTGNRLKATAVGEVILTVTKAGNEEYKEASVEVRIEITKAVPAVVPAYEAVREKGKTLADVNLDYNGEVNGTIKWVREDGTELDSTTEILQNVSYKWLFTPTDGANYESAAGTITLWAYEASKWQENGADYFQKEQKVREDRRQQHTQEWYQYSQKNNLW